MVSVALAPTYVDLPSYVGSVSLVPTYVGVLSYVGSPSLFPFFFVEQFTSRRSAIGKTKIG